MDRELLEEKFKNIENQIKGLEDVIREWNSTHGKTISALVTKVSSIEYRYATREYVEKLIEENNQDLKLPLISDRVQTDIANRKFLYALATFFGAGNLLTVVGVILYFIQEYVAK